MSLSSALPTPFKCILVNVATSESLSVLFNPTELVERVSVNYSRLGVLGLSHQLLQYQHTSNRQLPSVEFYFDKLFAAEAPGDPDIDDFRSFLRALTVPPASAEMTPPPRALVLWPNVLTIETVLTDLEFHYKSFGPHGHALVYTATCTFEEILDVRVTSEDRRAGG